MKLVIFDLDGTLTRTNQVDEICFVQAFADAHAITGINTNWNEYSETTDSGITRQIFRERKGRDPKPRELLRLQDRFRHLLREQLDVNPELFAEISGAGKMLARLSGQPEWAIAVATGCWQVSAELKFEAADLALNDFPRVFAEMGFAREEILQTATAKAAAHYRQNSFERAVSIGDALWDVRAAKNLNLSFVGIGDGNWAASLSKAGASHVLADYQDYDLFLEYLNSAEVPADNQRS